MKTIIIKNNIVKNLLRERRVASGEWRGSDEKANATVQGFASQSAE